MNLARASAGMEMQTEATEPQAAPSRWSGLQLRVVSALVMLTVVLFAIIAGGMWFITLIIFACLQMMREWDGLTQRESKRWQMAGFAYIAIPCASLIWLRDFTVPDVENAGMRMVLYVMFVVWATDIGAYFTGRHVGGPKLAPAISPNKTWAGLGGGILAAGAIGGICASFVPYPFSFAGCIGVGMVLAAVSQGGDLFESWLKRRVGVKDSGSLIPGHGGLLDRVDGLIAATPVYALLVGMSGL
jgi:phosphatidate cytidylyltransferase